MVIPEEIRAFARTYKITRDNEETEEFNCWGFVDAYKDKITLKERGEEFTQGHEKQVFMHELIHVIDNVLGICIGEKKTQLLAVGLVTVIEDNGLDFCDAS